MQTGCGKRGICGGHSVAGGPLIRIKNAVFPLWRRLPARPRQWVAHKIFGLVSLLRPGPSPLSQELAGDLSLPVVIVGFLSSPSGLGQAARLAAEAYQQRGSTVYGVDLSHRFFEKAGSIAHAIPDGRGISGPAHVIVNINAPYMPYALWLLGRKFLRGKHVTGYWAWELPAVPSNWKRGFACVHDIAVPSRFVAQAIERLDAGKPVRVAPHPVSLAAPPARDRIAGPYSAQRPFTVLSVLNVASGFERKNPLALIRAFKLAFADDPACRLRLLVSNTEHYPVARTLIEAEKGDADNIEIAWNAMDRAAFLAWWGTPDLYASLHRAEGFGLPLAEAMCAGYPVLATGWSGNTEFMDEENSFLVGCRMVDVLDAQSKYPTGLTQWAEPDIHHAVELMRKARAEPGLSDEKAGRGRRAVLGLCDAQTFCARVQGVPDSAPRARPRGK